MSKFIAPAFKQTSFHCPNCNVFSEQVWTELLQCYGDAGSGRSNLYAEKAYSLAKCKYCSKTSIWSTREQNMIYPNSGNTEMPNDDLPNHIKEIYNEAKNIVNVSPRGAIALLRLALQELCIHLGEGNNLNTAIKNLIKKGLPPTVQQTLDIIRVTGNHAVHPGQIDISDKPEIAKPLFQYINIISDFFISQPKRIAEAFSSLPEPDKESIAKRDGAKV